MFRRSFLSVGVFLAGLSFSLPSYAFETTPSSSDNAAGATARGASLVILSTPFDESAEIHPTSHTYLKTGVADISSNEAMNWQPGQYYRQPGTLGVAETGFRNEGRDQFGVGGWEYKANPDAFTPPDSKPIQGMYVLAERSFYNEDGKNVLGFARVGRAAGNLEQTRNGWSTGLVWKGFVDDHPDGQFGFAVSGGASPQRNTNNVSMGGMETRLELTYQDKISDNVTIQPGLSFTVNPGNDPGAAEGLVAGLRIHARFK